MSDNQPNHHDVEIALRAYELRREPVMRESRDAVMKEFLPKSYEEFIAVTQPAHPLNAAYRQVSSYWEMVYGFCKYGAVHANLFMESNAEGLFLFAKVRPFLERFRKEGSPAAFMNAEWVATQCEVGKQRLAYVEKRVAQMMEARTKG